MNKHKLLTFGFGLAIGLGIFWVTNAQSSAAPVCMNDLGRRNTAGQVSNTYPRTGTSVASSFFCGAVGNGQQWVLLSSYYHNGAGAPGSTLHTPNAQFRIFSNGQPTSAITVRVERSATGRCNYTSGTDVGVAKFGPNTAVLGALDGAYYIDISIPAAEFIKDTKYGQNAWVWNHYLRAFANELTSVHCRIRATSFTSNSYVTLFEDNNPQNPHAEFSQKFNQNNAGVGNGSKRILGPFVGNGGAIALYSDIDNATLEYAVPIQLDCTRLSGQFYLRFYDPDSPSVFNPAGTSQPAGVAGLAIYRDSDGALLYDNPNVTQGNDEYGEILMPSMDPNIKYSMVWYNITAKNGIQFWMPFSEATRIPGNTCEPPGPQMECSFRAIPTVNASSVVEVFVTITNRSPNNWGGGTSTEIAVVDPVNSYALVNGQATAFNWSDPGIGVGPPDHNSAGYINYQNGADTSVHDESYSKLGPAPQPPDATVRRFFPGNGIPSGGSREYSVFMIAPSGNGASKDYGIRLLDRPPVDIPSAAAYAWLNWDPTCRFTLTTTDASAAIVTCGELNSIPDEPEPGEPITINVAARNDSLPAVPALSGYSFNVTIPSGNANYGYSPNPLPSGATGRSSDISIAAGLTAGNYTITWTFNNGSVSTPLCSGTLAVKAKPYVRFYGNDVASGGGFATGCSATPSADNRTLAYGRYGTSGVQPQNYDNYRGSASELAIFAAGQITGVLPGSQRNRGTIFNELSFANNANNYNLQQYDYNGGFGGSICANDYYASRPAVAPTSQAIVNINTSPIGTSYYQPPGGSTYAQFTTTGPISGRRVIYVNGDVVMGASAFANTNIVYSSGPWAADLSNIPSLYIIASGDIYIDDNVQNLDGVYIAQPRNATTGGEILTCSLYNFGVNLIEPAVDSTQIIQNCNTKLTVNGAFIAERVNLLRSVGTIRGGGAYEGSGSGSIAEVFNFSPEAYLVRGGGLPPISTGQAIDSIISLPPSF